MCRETQGWCTQAQARLTQAMELVTKELVRFEAEWRDKALQKLQARAHRLWRKGQKPSTTEAWRFDLNHATVSPFLLQVLPALEYEAEEAVVVINRLGA